VTTGGAGAEALRPLRDRFSYEFDYFIPFDEHSPPDVFPWFLSRCSPVGGEYDEFFRE